ncbi:unnamed protein product [Prunus armeniaca]|uniref:AB hydrolase-1 domain-containing protein n=1 Tax=Prunus armeniaca TaxID=36596 RepID=A0A6J5VS87_PRUAR|nr:unnamed protein product [Prunus armeniaca]
MDCLRFSGLHETSANSYELLVQAATLIPIWHYLCHVLHGRYLATPWLTSPHLQNFFLNFFGNPPAATYQRELFRLSDGGTIALDWAVSSYVLPKDDTTPIVVVLPGLTSDSQSSYIRHLAFNTAKMGWNVVISNHIGLGGVPINSDLVYNCGWTKDIREVCNRLHHKHPKAPLYLIGTSIDVSADIEYVLGANILVNYLGEDGDNAPVSGAAAISNPWDFLIGDRFIRRTYTSIAIPGLRIGMARCVAFGITMLPVMWASLRLWTRFIGAQAAPFMCAMCRKYDVVLATTKHGSHLAFFEGISASRIWWVRAVDEFFKVLHCGQYMHAHKKMKTSSGSELPLGSTIDQDKKLVLLGKVAAAVALAKLVAKKLGFVA